MEWQLADAKNKFTEIVDLALTDGPQKVTRANDAVVVINERDYNKLIGKHISFKDFLLKQKGQSLEDLYHSRDKSPMRSYEQ